VKYPNDNTLIAPGMSIVMNINFLPPSHSDFDDEILIITEDTSFTVKLMARREPPILTLPSVLGIVIISRIIPNRLPKLLAWGQNRHDFPI
jgi:hypothetical protein